MELFVAYLHVTGLLLFEQNDESCADYALTGAIHAGKKAKANRPFSRLNFHAPAQCSNSIICGSHFFLGFFKSCFIYL